MGKGGKPVLNLEFLLDDVVRNTVPLDWYVRWFGDLLFLCLLSV